MTHDMHDLDSTQDLASEPSSVVRVEPPLTSIAIVRKTIEQHFPDLWPAVDLGLATCATLLLEDNSNPVAVIFVGPPSSGKTTVAEMFADATVAGELLCYVSDNFTPASFVSHAANATPTRLGTIGHQMATTLRACL